MRSRRAWTSLLAALAAVAAVNPSSTWAAAGKPVNTSPPTISGTAEQGRTLTADPGAWSGAQPTSYAYEWRRCDAAGANCANLRATSKTYTLVVADVGSTLRVKVTAKNSAGNGSATSAATAVVATPPAQPANTSAPTIAGTAQDGRTLTADRGSWSGTQPIAYAYQWQRCDSLSPCSDILAATAQTYTLGSQDINTAIRVRVTATNSAGSASTTSATTALVQPAPVAPSNTSPPAISGTAREGEVLAAAPGGWSGTEPIAYAYQWQRCDATGGSCADVAGATGQTYALGGADVDAT